MLGLKRINVITNQHKIYTREELFNGPIKSMLGIGETGFHPTAWSKIYDASVLKSAVKNINEALYYGEDIYLNVWSFFDDNVKRVSTRAEAYYVWNTGIGFSSKKDSSLHCFGIFSI